MEFFSIIGIGIIAAILAIVLRQMKPEFAMLISLMAGVVILFAIIGSIAPLIEEIQNIMSAASLPTEYAQILLKALGICFITQLACDSCRDAGESAIASKVELAGRIAVLLISIPLFKEILTIASSFFGL